MKNNGNDRLFENQEDTETQCLSLVDLVKRIAYYLPNSCLSRRMFCFVENEARKCSYLSFLRGKPHIVNNVVLGMQKYHTLDKEERNLWLANNQRQVDKPTKLSNDPKKYYFPLFVGKRTDNDSKDIWVSYISDRDTSRELLLYYDV